MGKAHDDQDGPATPLWIRRPEVLHLVTYSVAVLVFIGQIVAVIVRGSDWETALSVLLAGGGVAVSWWKPWAGLVITSAASFAVTAVGQDPLSVWMMAVLVLFSVTFRGKQPLAGTAIVAACFLGAFMTVGGFRGGAVAGAAALFSAIAGGAAGAALRIHRDHWWILEERAENAIATREIEATRRVTEERLRIARDLHDVIGHQVAMLSLHLGVAEIGLPEGERSESSRQALVSARSAARTVVVETQRILALLRRGDEGSDDEALRPIPAMSGLEGLIASFESIGLEVKPSLELPTGFVEPSVGVTVYRVVQEALTNAYRHGEGTATVDVREQDGRIRVTVDNRVGRSPRGTASGSGLGLVGMRERVESSNGRLTIDSDDGRFRVCAEFSPLGTVVR